MARGTMGEQHRWILVLYDLLPQKHLADGSAQQQCNIAEDIGRPRVEVNQS